MSPKDTFDVAYSYLRFSELGRQAKGDSIRRQTAARDAWLAKNPHVRLDLTVRMRDEGVSALSGQHRINPRYALGQFLELVRNGDILPGSYLIVENLDRLTREHPRDSIRWVLDLIDADVRIVQLAPFEQVYDKSIDERTLFFMLSELSRGHAESVRKSTLIAPKWAEKKRLAREGVPYGRGVPAWIELADGAYRLRPGAREAFKLLFSLCASGLGSHQLTKRMNCSVCKSPAGGGKWTRGYIVRCLSNRAVLGEYQPMKGSKRRIPDGEPIPDYFPVVVTEPEWYAAQKAIALRTHQGGRPSRTGAPTSPFAGLLWSAVDQAKLQVKRHRKHNNLVSARVHEATSDRPQASFPLESLVDALLSQLRELSAADLFADPAVAEVEVIEGRLAEVTGKLNVARQRFKEDTDSAVWADIVSDCDRQARALTRELEEAKRAASNPVSGSWVEAVKLMRKNDPVRLRQLLLATVEGVWCVFVADGANRLAAVQVWFKGGESRRDYVIWHRTRYGVDAQKNPPVVKVASPETTIPVAYDLRNRDQALAVETGLRRFDLSLFDRS